MSSAENEQQDFRETEVYSKMLRVTRKLLHESGWDQKVEHACQEFILTNGVDKITLEQLIVEVKPIARQLIPESVKRDLLERLEELFI
ncbi:Enhancer of yellow 2 transcription factor homolog [Trichuris trichiura]|uniref:Enhancer of yellow 2 transcription factor homolog n=1 Tax=Trichuris trichiura TaxID=36087 RepID=A0A077YZL6_TRITR|nr:Enhancer of yellow 2 transcription factor homolog [Trichuris trichiura]